MCEILINPRGENVIPNCELLKYVKHFQNASSVSVRLRVYIDVERPR